jgi:phenylalanine dehydrogenase
MQLYEKSSRFDRNFILPTRITEYDVFSDECTFSVTRFQGFKGTDYNPSSKIVEATIVLCNLGTWPGLGGTRRVAEYGSLKDRIKLNVDLAFSGMLFKIIATGLLDNDGAKGVLVSASGDPLHLQWYGQCATWINTPNKRFYTAADSGINTPHLIEMAKTCDAVASLPKEMGGSGDSSLPTALGLEMGVRGVQLFRHGTEDLCSTAIAVAGICPIFQANKKSYISSRRS